MAAKIWCILLVCLWSLLGCNGQNLQQTMPRYPVLTLSAEKEWPSIEGECDRQDRYFREKKSDDLVREYRQKLLEHPESPVWYFLYGRLLALLGEHEYSLHLFSLSIAKDPDFVWGYYGFGVYYLKKNSFLQALPYLHKSLILDPQFVPSLVAMAKAYIGKDLDKSLEYLDKALAIHPQDAALHHNIAHVLIIAKREDEALAKFAQAASLASQNREILQDFAKLLIQRKEYQRAIEVTEKLLTLVSGNTRKKLQKTLILLRQVAASHREQ